MIVAGSRLLVPVTAGRHDLAERLRDAGAHVEEVEYIAVTQASDPQALAAATARWCHGEFDWLAVTSRNAVLAMERVARARGLSLAAAVPPARVAAVGEATARACRGVGLEVALVPGGSQDAEGMIAEFPAGPGTVLAPLGDLAASTLTRGLAGKHWDVTRVEAYRVVDGPGVSASAAAALAAGEFHAVLLTSGSVAERYARHAAAPHTGTLVVAIGRTTAAVASAAGVHVDAIAVTPSYDGILDALEGARKGST